MSVSASVLRTRRVETAVVLAAVLQLQLVVAADVRDVDAVHQFVCQWLVVLQPSHLHRLRRFAKRTFERRVLTRCQFKIRRRKCSRILYCFLYTGRTFTNKVLWRLNYLHNVSLITIEGECKLVLVMFVYVRSSTSVCTGTKYSGYFTVLATCTHARCSALRESSRTPAFRRRIQT